MKDNSKDTFQLDKIDMFTKVKLGSVFFYRFPLFLVFLTHTHTKKKNMYINLLKMNNARLIKTIKTIKSLIMNTSFKFHGQMFSCLKVNHLEQKR